ncbi:MAG: signal peptidase I [Planctomycetes bacterium]|nr:signal peptidase I [Planctomycetota bacterium]
MELLFPVLVLAISVLAIAGFWKVLAKAGQPGWAAIVPIYNVYALLQVAGRPGWWLLLMLIPIVNVVVAFMVSFDVARRFGKDSGFGIGLALLGVVFYPILGFGDATYKAGRRG